MSHVTSVDMIMKESCHVRECVMWVMSESFNVCECIMYAFAYVTWLEWVMYDMCHERSRRRRDTPLHCMMLHLWTQAYMSHVTYVWRFHGACIGGWCEHEMLYTGVMLQIWTHKKWFLGFRVSRIWACHFKRLRYVCDYMCVILLVRKSRMSYDWQHPCPIYMRD